MQLFPTSVSGFSFHKLICSYAHTTPRNGCAVFSRGFYSLQISCCDRPKRGVYLRDWLNSFGRYRRRDRRATHDRRRRCTDRNRSPSDALARPTIEWTNVVDEMFSNNAAMEECFSVHTCVSCSVVVSRRASGLKQTGSVSSNVGREWVNRGFIYLKMGIQLELVIVRINH